MYVYELSDLLALLLEYVRYVESVPTWFNRSFLKQFCLLLLLLYSFHETVKASPEFFEATQLRQQLLEIIGLHVLWMEHMEMLQLEIHDITWPKIYNA